VGLYSQFIFPRLCELALNTEAVAKHRHDLLAQAEGNILEIGFGTGLNLPHYPEWVRRLTIVDPNAGMHRLAQKRIQQRGMEIDHRLLSSEQVPFESGSFDCVVSTFTLCSIENVNQAIAEVYRVLKPGGKFLFLEHGLSPEPSVQRWQHRLNWLQKKIGDGCNLDRNVKELIGAKSFSSVAIDECYLEKALKTHGYLYRGVATR
jgi:ubiquinone/menaquinone biosynthesis C-methylase UbiE